MCRKDVIALSELIAYQVGNPACIDSFCPSLASGVSPRLPSRAAGIELARSHPRSIESRFVRSYRDSRVTVKPGLIALRLPVQLWDERLSSVAAHEILDEAGHGRSGRKYVID